jgi:hypothetical protein
MSHSQNTHELNALFFKDPNKPTVEEQFGVIILCINANLVVYKTGDPGELDNTHISKTSSDVNGKGP